MSHDPKLARASPRSKWVQESWSILRLRMKASRRMLQSILTRAKTPIWTKTTSQSKSCDPKRRSSSVLNQLALRTAAECRIWRAPRKASPVKTTLRPMSWKKERRIRKPRLNSHSIIVMKRLGKEFWAHRIRETLSQIFRQVLMIWASKFLTLTTWRRTTKTSRSQVPNCRSTLKEEVLFRTTNPKRASMMVSTTARSPPKTSV